MIDKIERVISQDGSFFGIACSTTTLVTEACRRHDTGPLAATALGRALTGAVLLAALLKDGQSVLLKFEGNGPLRKVITEAGYDGWARGYVANPHAELPLKDRRIDVAGGIGRAGFLTITKKISEQQKYPGTIQLYSSEISDDIAYYLTQSEQTPSAIALTVQLEPDGRISAAGGFLIQSLPPANETLLSNIEQQMNGLAPLSELLSMGRQPAEILSQIFSQVPHKNIGSKQLVYACSCSKEKMETALLSLQPMEIRELMEKEKGAEVVCEFCRNSYQFNVSELAQLLDANQKEQY